jgi:general secretion pathway protein E
MTTRDTTAPIFDADTLARARALAAANHRHIVAELEVLTGIEPRQLLQSLAQQLAMEVIETAASACRFRGRCSAAVRCCATRVRWSVW